MKSNRRINLKSDLGLSGNYTVWTIVGVLVAIVLVVYLVRTL